MWNLAYSDLRQDDIRWIKMNLCADFKGWFPLRFASWLMTMATTTPTTGRCGHLNSTGKNYGIQPMGQRPISNQAPAWKSSKNPSISGKPQGITKFLSDYPRLKPHNLCGISMNHLMTKLGWPAAHRFCISAGVHVPHGPRELMWDGYLTHQLWLQRPPGKQT